MNVFLPILPVVLLGLTCAVVCLWNLHAIDKFLRENPEGVAATNAQGVTDLPTRLSK
jgi:hypothetical protein